MRFSQSPPMYFVLLVEGRGYKQEFLFRSPMEALIVRLNNSCLKGAKGKINKSHSERHSSAAAVTLR